MSQKQSSLVKTLAYASKTLPGHCPSCSSVPWKKKKINTGSVFRRHESAQSNSHHRGSRLGSGSLRLIPCGDPLKSHMSRGHLTARFLFATFTLRWKTPKSHWLSFPDSSVTFVYLFFNHFTIFCAASFTHPPCLSSHASENELKLKVHSLLPIACCRFTGKLNEIIPRRLNELTQ